MSKYLTTSTSNKILKIGLILGTALVLTGSPVVFAAPKTTPTLSVTNSPVTYNGSAQAADVSASAFGNQVSGTVSNIEYNGTTTIPTNAGTYAVTASFKPTDTNDFNTLTNASAGNFVINQATPTLSVTNSPATYDGSQQTATVTSTVPGSVTNIKYNNSSTAPTNPGTYAVTANFTPTDSTNYKSLSSASAGDFVISKIVPTLSVTNSPVTYDGFGQSADVSGSVPGNVSNIKYDGSSSAPTDAGTYTVTADFTPTNSNEYETLSDASAGSFVVSPLAVVLSGNRTYDGTTVIDASDLSVENSVGHDDVYVASGSGTIANKDVGSESIVSFGNLALGGHDDGNYTLTNATGSVRITTRDLTVTATGVDKVYDGAKDATVNLSDNKVGTDDVTDSYTSASFLDKNVGNHKTIFVSGISISGSDAGNYTLTDLFTFTTADITQASLTVTATGINKVYDGTTNATVDLSTNAFAGDDVDANYTSATFATSSVGTDIPITVDGISISGGDAGNYSLSNTTADTEADITQSSATITLDTSNLNPTYNCSPESVDVLSTNPAGLSNVVTYNGSQTAPTDAGIYTVLASITDPNYSGTSSVVLTIAQATATIAVTPYNVTYDGDPQIATDTAAGVCSDDLSSDVDLSNTVHTDAGDYATDAWDFTDPNGNYSAQMGTIDDTINQAVPVLSVINSPVTYDGTPYGASVTSSVPGVISNILTGGAASQTDVGTYPVTADFTPTDSTDYQTLASASAGNFNIVSSTADLITGFTFGLTGEVDTIGTSTIAVTVPFGTDVSTLTPTIDLSTGATVDPLSGVAQDFTNPVTYTVTAQDGVTTQDYQVTVTVGPFVPTIGGGSQTYTISASAGNGGTISPSGLVTLAFGGSQSFTITPNSGYQISALTVNGASVATSSTYTFSDVTSSNSISASFSQIATNGGTGTSTPQGQVLGISTTTPSTGQVLGTSTFFFATNLGLGMDSNDVKQLQIRLTNEGEYTGPITGYFGKLTFAAVEKYQTEHSVVWITGYVGFITRGILNGILPSNPTPAQQLSYLQTELTGLQNSQ